MQDSTLITVITRNEPEKIGRFLGSVAQNDSLNKIPILIVDDSQYHDRKPAERNSSAITSGKTDGLDITHVTQKEWAVYKQRILDIVGSGDLLDPLVLGTESWNTPNVRNICQVLTLAIFKRVSTILYFDDDIDVNGFNLPRDFQARGMEGIPILGCPDLSRFEWIQLYLRLTAHFLSIPQDGKLNYPDNLIEKYGVEKNLGFVRKYTDLSMGRFPTSQNGIVGCIPSREEISGGAYVNTRDNLFIGTFPSFYNEDWAYAHMIRHHTKTQNRFLKDGVIHASSVKTVLNLQRLMDEEKGEFFQLFYRNIGHHGIAQVILDRYKVISEEIALCKMILSKAPDCPDNSVIVLIHSMLQKLLEFYVCLQGDSSEYSKAYQDHQGEIEHWRALAPEIESLSLI